MERLTYKSQMGDYGLLKDFADEFEEKYTLRNALGKYEDLGYTPDELKNFLPSKKMKFYK